MDADAIVVGGGLAGLVATCELIDAGRKVILLDQEPRAVARRPGVLVVRRAVLRRHRPSSGAAASATRATSPAGLAGLGRLRPRRRTTGRASGPRPTSTSRPARSAPGCTRRACAGFPIVGWAERGGYLADRARQLGAALPRHLGHRARRRRAVRARACARRAEARAACRCASATASTSSTTNGGAVDGVRGDGPGAERRRARRAELARRRSATSRCRRRR